VSDVYTFTTSNTKADLDLCPEGTRFESLQCFSSVSSGLFLELGHDHWLWAPPSLLSNEL